MTSSPAPANQPTRRATPVNTIAFYWRIAVKPHPQESLTLLFLMVGSAVLDAVSIGLAVPLLDVLTAQGPTPQGRIVSAVQTSLTALGINPTRPALVFTLLLVSTLFFLGRSVLSLLNVYWTAAVGVRMRRTMRVRLFEKFLNARYEPVSTRSRGTILQDINQPSESLCGSIIQLGYFLTGVLNSLIMVALLMYFSWWLTLVIGVLAVGGIQGWRWYADRRAAGHGRTLYGLTGAQNILQVDAIDGLKIVKARVLEHWMVARQDQLLAAEFKPELRLVFFQYGPLLVNELVAGLLVLSLGAITFLFPSLGVRFSLLAAFLLAIRRIAPAMATINRASVTLSRYRPHLEVIEEVLNALPQESRSGAQIDQVHDIQLIDVDFTYASRPNQPVLTRMTAGMSRGTVTAIVGPTGSGKSTVANLLMGFYEPQAGSILVNGGWLGQIDLHAWRRQVGYVPQDVFVFNATIRDNIVLGDESVSTAELERATRVAQLQEFVASLPEGYGTVVGDRGLRLSGGQCQRLAIARAILRQPQVLIFDEATSALDNLTERAVYEAISSLRRHAIVIVIAHRLSSIREADQILVLQGGRVVESGTHARLTQQRGMYARLYAQEERAAAPASQEEDYVAT